MLWHNISSKIGHSRIFLVRCCFTGNTIRNLSLKLPTRQEQKNFVPFFQWFYCRWSMRNLYCQQRQEIFHDDVICVVPAAFIWSKHAWSITKKFYYFSLTLSTWGSNRRISAVLVPLRFNFNTSQWLRNSRTVYFSNFAMRNQTASIGTKLDLSVFFWKKIDRHKNSSRYEPPL